jgi:hypothetical protein
MEVSDGWQLMAQDPQGRRILRRGGGVCSKMTPLLLTLFRPHDPNSVGDRYLDGYVLSYGCTLPLLAPCAVMSQSPIWAMLLAWVNILSSAISRFSHWAFPGLASPMTSS